MPMAATRFVWAVCLVGFYASCFLYESASLHTKEEPRKTISVAPSNQSTASLVVGGNATIVLSAGDATEQKQQVDGQTEIPISSLEVGQETPKVDSKNATLQIRKQKQLEGRTLDEAIRKALELQRNQIRTTDKLLPPNFRLSGRVFPRPLKFRERNLKMHGQNVSFVAHYQCAGKEYDQFMMKAFQMVQTKCQVMNSSLAEEGWGRRPSIVPPSSRNRTILLMGNSHARQVAQAMEWQYRDQIHSFQRHFQPDEPPGHTVETFSIPGTDKTLTIVGLFNHPAFYSSRWLENLEQDILQCAPLNDCVDAIVMGYLNRFKPKFRSSNLWSAVSKYSQEHPEQQVDMDHHVRGFSFESLAQAYKGPLISMTTFWNETGGPQRRIGGRTNLHQVDSRRYIPLIAGGQSECSSNEKRFVGKCHADKPQYHRCMGNSGGLPDFTSWELIEVFHKLFQEEDAKAIQ